MTDLAAEEYAALRATIRERGTARVWLAFASLATWAALALAFVLFGAAPAFALIPLTVLAGGFQAVFSLHLGVERIGRYIQAFAEDGASGPAAMPRWETMAMAFGRGARGATADPLFGALFLIAAFLNLLPALVANATRAELVTIGGAHLLFGVRVLIARRAAASQREQDLARFRALRDRPPAGA
jgi:hypothetical protein